MMNNPLAGIGATPSAATKAQAALDQAHSIGAPTQRERDYVDAVGSYYKDFAVHTERERQIARGAAYEALAAKYPNDDEAQIFGALYIAATQAQSDQTYSAYARAVAILEPMFRKYPDHPGVAHYLIHAYDAPPLARRDWKPPVPTQRSRRMRHMRNTCPRTSSPEWSVGKLSHQQCPRNCGGAAWTRVWRSAACKRLLGLRRVAALTGRRCEGGDRPSNGDRDARPARAR